jgi:hypothetical protein
MNTKKNRYIRQFADSKENALTLDFGFEVQGGHQAPCPPAWRNSIILEIEANRRRREELSDLPGQENRFDTISGSAIG